ncbi:Autophagy protein 7 [Kickxella alabastrina]|uniref:Autophagy protein 7 n=1 Tax=Kickxella alabastrina TaxID=61397 RepID=A0ACC1IFM4_9FUNG|nr:Autophagy protein 7 [Kickxella alabastrina]
MERVDTELNHKYARFMALGLGLLYVGTQDKYDTILETLKVVTHPIGQQASIMMQVCAYTGTGNVLEVQKMLHICAEHLGDKEDQLPQAFAVLGVALISMGETVGSEMSLRTFDHLMQYGDPVVRRTVPLAMAIVCASNPLVGVLDTLNKYSHDNDKAVATSAVFAMGIVGAGTNNARLAQLLRQLATYYHKDTDILFTVRISQGLLHMGKGTLTVNPYHHDRSLLSHTALAGLLIPIVAMTNAEKLILTDSHFLLYYLVRAMYPRFLITFNEELEAISTSVRVGQAVDAVGQVGRPKTITGFQAHETPVLLGHAERSEIATDKYIPLTNVLEGFVILKKNPEYVEEEEETKNSTVEPEFWSKLGHHKLHSAQLDTARTTIRGEFTGGRRHAVRNNAAGAEVQRLAVPARLRVSQDAWTTDSAISSQLGASVSGHLYNTNTIEEFKKSDKGELLRGVGGEVLDAIHSGRATEEPQLLWPFVLLSFADLKKYRFYHWFGFPAVTADPADTADAVTPIGLFVDSNADIDSLHKTSEFAGATGAFLVRYKAGEPWRLYSLGEWEQAFGNSDGGEAMLAFVDPSSHATRPGWPLRNLLAWLRYTHADVSKIRVLCLRDAVAESIVVDINVTAATELKADRQVSGWERNERDRLAPRVADLSAAMDPVLLAESALDLNLQLMRWRLAPSVDLAKVAGTRALLVGSGTLGAYTARALLAWGVRTITFVDNGRVSFSNPARQPLYDFADSLDGGKPKAAAAAEAMRRIFPNVDASGVQMSIPMPGHAVAPAEIDSVRAAVTQLENLIRAHDVVFLLTDSRESRWLPSLLGALHSKIVICVALGFDSFVAMRHGVHSTEDAVGARLGCYFCNDVVAPTDSLTDRTLDQQCTVTRPGLAPIASGTAVELLTAIIQHPLGAHAPAPAAEDDPDSASQGVFGVPPHQIRGYLRAFRQHTIVGQSSNMCTACSPKVLDAYRQYGFDFLLRAFNNTLVAEDAPHYAVDVDEDAANVPEGYSYLETLTGLAALHRQTDDIMADIMWSEGEDEDADAANDEDFEAI